MCSGARSSSANGAIAARAAPACSWSTSSSTVLSDCTIRGPSVIPSIIRIRRTPGLSACRGGAAVGGQAGLDAARHIVAEHLDEALLDAVEGRGGDRGGVGLGAVDVGDHVGVHEADVKRGN